MGGISEIAASCASPEALERLQDRNRPLLNALGRERPDLYSNIGASFAARTEALKGEGCVKAKAANGQESTNPNGGERAKPPGRSPGGSRSTRPGADPGRGPKRRATVIDRSAAKRRPSKTATKTSIAMEESHAPDVLSETA